MKIHLVDGTFELFRSFFGAPKAENALGQEIGATRGLVRSMLRLLDDADYVAVTFDHVIESFRNDLFAGYKTGAGIDPRLHSQFHLAEDACRALGLVVWPMVEFEADDALGTGVHLYRTDPRVEQIIVCTPDKDMAQCVEGRRVVTLDRIRKTVRDEAGVIEKFGVPPASIPDLLALIGDTADGIPGIPRWGAKSAASVLAHYGHIEDIPADPDWWQVKVRGARTLAANLREQREDALLYKKLATLRRDVPIEESVDDLLWRGADRPAMQKMATRLDDKRVLERIPKWR